MPTGSAALRLTLHLQPTVAGRFLETCFTPKVLAAQQHYFGRSQHLPPQPERDALTDDERAFIEARDSFYMATVSENGWPYVQHRGGRPGFLRVVSPTQLAFADYKGNRQMLSTGNLAANDRVALFLMDYPRRERLKILGHARVEDARQHPELVAQFAEPEARSIVERVFLIEVVSFDWNCPKYITPRYTAAEVEEAIAPLRTRIAELEGKA
ncbi:MAG: pyridoxamine 5'-phosphate oxidase-like FMN-binding protein [Limisphaerales bacterium]|nr:MAG: pyridoxamine 5'-phosphate oxidase-like FMN-binding protein [Limisphaerales bacterium]TXT45698.1 MAG: pyridoxamine 5'-phosphate oxidase-like FMN-binding protein [Limisphaerales bacterium]